MAATRARSNPTAELEELEERWSRAKAEADELGRDLRDKHERAQELAGRRQHRIAREPGLVDHLGQPLDPDGEIAQIDLDIAGLGDLADLHARFGHARTLEGHAKAATQAHIERRFDELVEDLRPRAEAAAAAVREKADDLLDAVGDYLGIHGESVALTVPMRGIDGRHVPGIDLASELRRILEPLEMPAPLPNRDRRYA